MRTSRFVAPVLIFVFAICIFPGVVKEDLAELAVSGNEKIAERAIARLRALGETGLDSLLNAHGKEIRRFTERGVRTARWRRITKAIDRVSGQKDAYASGLFWYTDLAKAQEAARSKDRLVLSLRLLGNLDEEFSCANSRFFRSILYSDSSISNYLKKHYVLHWQSVRPAPRITIDFGDGRKLVRTVTGNSVHYVLDTDGGVIDALPGLYGPSAFLEYLETLNTSRKAAARDSGYWESFRRARRLALLSRLDIERKRAAGPIKTRGRTGIDAPDAAKSIKRPPTAIAASRRAVTKTLVERPSVTEVLGRSLAEDDPDEQAALVRIARNQGPARISERSIAFIRWKLGNARSFGSEEFSSMIRKLERSVALDTARNEYLFHTRIYGWLANKDLRDLTILNNKIYSELFLTPRDDRWLGLYSPDVFSGLENNGIVQDKNDNE